jgi:uncharacterized protein YuzE
MSTESTQSGPVAGSEIGRARLLQRVHEAIRLRLLAGMDDRQAAVRRGVAGDGGLAPARQRCGSPRIAGSGVKYRFTAHALEQMASRRLDRIGLPDALHRKVLEADMKARYDTETDTLTLLLRTAPVHESDEGNPGVILDYDREGNVVSIEILDASTRVEDPRKVEYLASAR